MYCNLEMAVCFRFMGIYGWTKMTLQYLELWQSKAHARAASWTQHRAPWSTCQVSLSEVKGSHPNLCFHSQRKHTFATGTVKKHEINQTFLEHVLDPNCLNLLLMAMRQYTRPEQSKGCVSNLNFAIPQLYEPYRAVSEHHTEPQTRQVEALNTIPTVELATKTPGQRCALLCITQDSICRYTTR